MLSNFRKLRLRNALPITVMGVTFIVCSPAYRSILYVRRRFDCQENAIRLALPFPPLTIATSTASARMEGRATLGLSLKYAADSLDSQVVMVRRGIWQRERAVTSNRALSRMRGNPLPATSLRNISK